MTSLVNTLTDSTCCHECMPVQVLVLGNGCAGAENQCMGLLLRFLQASRGTCNIRPGVPSLQHRCSKCCSTFVVDRVPAPVFGVFMRPCVFRACVHACTCVYMRAYFSFGVHASVHDGVRWRACVRTSGFPQVHAHVTDHVRSTASKATLQPRSHVSHPTHPPTCPPHPSPSQSSSVSCLTTSGVSCRRRCTLCSPPVRCVHGVCQGEFARECVRVCKKVVRDAGQAM